MLRGVKAYSLAPKDRRARFSGLSPLRGKHTLSPKDSWLLATLIQCWNRAATVTGSKEPEAGYWQQKQRANEIFMNLDTELQSIDEQIRNLKAQKRALRQLRKLRSEIKAPKPPRSMERFSVDVRFYEYNEALFDGIHALAPVMTRSQLAVHFGMPKVKLAAVVRCMGIKPLQTQKLRGETAAKIEALRQGIAQDETLVQLGRRIGMTRQGAHFLIQRHGLDRDTNHDLSAIDRLLRDNPKLSEFQIYQAAYVASTVTEFVSALAGLGIIITIDWCKQHQEELGIVTMGDIREMHQKRGFLQCAGCREAFPKSKQFFNQEATRARGFSPYCKKCAYNRMLELRIRKQAALGKTIKPYGHATHGRTDAYRAEQAKKEQQTIEARIRGCEILFRS